jgi:hypothetical protein
MVVKTVLCEVPKGGAQHQVNPLRVVAQARRDCATTISLPQFTHFVRMGKHKCWLCEGFSQLSSKCTLYGAASTIRPNCSEQAACTVESPISELSILLSILIAG